MRHFHITIHIYSPPQFSVWFPVVLFYCKNIILLYSCTTACRSFRLLAASMFWKQWVKLPKYGYANILWGRAFSTHLANYQRVWLLDHRLRAFGFVWNLPNYLPKWLYYFFTPASNEWGFCNFLFSPAFDTVHVSVSHCSVLTQVYNTCVRVSLLS